MRNLELLVRITDFFNILRECDATKSVHNKTTLVRGFHARGRNCASKGMEWFSEVSTTEWIIVVILLLVIIVQVKDILFPAPNPVPVPLVKEKKKVVQVRHLQYCFPVYPHPQRDFTLEELREYTGANEKPIYLCAKGVVYDLSDGASFYGPGGPYAVFAGHDASRCLATVRCVPAPLRVGRSVALLLFPSFLLLTE